YRIAGCGSPTRPPPLRPPTRVSVEAGFNTGELGGSGPPRACDFLISDQVGISPRAKCLYRAQVVFNRCLQVETPSYLLSCRVAPWASRKCPHRRGRLPPAPPSRPRDTPGALLWRPSPQ